MPRRISIEQMGAEEHKDYHRRLFYVFTIILLLLFGGATFYHFFEGWRYLDALYFSTATMTTVGYGDITPVTDNGKLFTIFYAFAGVAIALYGLSLMASHFVEIREEFWLAKIGGMNMRGHTKTFWGKLSGLFNNKSEKLVSESEKAIKRK